MADNLTKKEIEELKKIQKETHSPEIEPKVIPLVRNTYKIKDKKISQYKINIPKKFADFLEFDKKNIKVEAKLDKKNKKITFEVFENH